ncbi:MAG: histone H1-like repetitive region-containing protein [Azonexus sp.]|nr:histone H1-like repetitive region-containing protein [Azonexus sp.]
MKSIESDSAPKLPTDPLPVSAMDASALVLQHVRRTSPQRGKLFLPLLLSLLAHALILSLTFGGQEFGLPGFAFPWQERRIEAPDLRILLAPMQSTEAKPAMVPPPLPLPPELIEPTVVAGPVLVTFKSPEQPPNRPAPKIVFPSVPMVKDRPRPKAAIIPTPTNALPDVLVDAPRPPKAFPAVIALDKSKEADFFVPPAPLESSDVISVEPGDSGGAAQARVDQRAREQIAEEAARAESERREAERQENARQAATREESAKKEAARQEAARAESERREAERQESARQAATREESAKKEAARQEAARAESERREAEHQENARQAATREELAKKEAARQEASRAESERQENARQATARQEAARKEDDARRDAARRAMGKQLDEEAARREAVQAARDRSPSSSGLRRVRLFGRSDPNAEVILYAEAWSRKIYFSMAFDIVREPAKQPHTDPTVTVAIRSDGSVESVTFVRSSGVAAIDDAIRRIIQNQTPYLPFQPGLARDFDVIEIRRTWHFDTAIRLY